MKNRHAVAPDPREQIFLAATIPNVATEKEAVFDGEYAAGVDEFAVE